MAEQPLAAEQIVLLVEDDALLRKTITTALTNEGFSIVEASDGTVAIDILRDGDQQIDMVLLDFELPGASSLEVFRQAKNALSSARVVVMSAHPRRTINAAFAGLEIDDFIRKPFRVNNLVRMLRNKQSA